MYTVVLQPDIDAPWTALKPVQIGGFGRSRPERADIFVLVKDHDSPAARIDFYFSAWDYHGFESGHGFDAAMVWHEYVVVGAGQRVFFVGLRSNRVLSYAVESYFGGMHATGDGLFVTSAESLYCFDPNGVLVWCCRGLGLDGIVIRSMTDTEIHGEGEWEPPGGWRPFVVDRKNGRRLCPLSALPTR